MAAFLRVCNVYPAGRVMPPVTTPERSDRPTVTVVIEWDDGRTGKVAGSAVRWTSEAILVAFSGPDGFGRQEWFSTDVVRLS